MGEEAKKEPSWLVKIGLAGGIVALGVWFFNRPSIEEQVAKDTVQQYQIAKNGSDPMQTCVHAGLVAAAYLQAKDSAQYNRWKAQEKADCVKAGVTAP